MPNQAANPPQAQGFPNLDAPFVDKQDMITLPWYQLLVTLWNKLGGSGVPIQTQALNSGTPGGKSQVLTTGQSPFTYTANEIGQVIVTRPYSLTGGTFTREAGGEVIEYSRDGGTTWYYVGCAPAQIWLSARDVIRVNWFTPGPPLIVYFPIE